MNGRRLLAGVLLFLFIVAITSISSSGVLAAEEPQFILEVENLVIDVDDYTTMTITMINAEGATIKEFVGTNWFYLPYEETSKNNKNIDGTMYYEVAEIYSIYPYYAGQFKFWVLIEYNGKTYMTNKVELTITDGDTNNSEQVKKSYLKTTLSDSDVYLGQKTVLAYQEYSIHDLSTVFFMDNLQIKDVLFTGAPEEELKVERAVYDGMVYNRTDVEVSYLTPLKPGIFTIPARDFYGYISMTEQQGNDESTIREFSEPKELIVRPLPTKNQPADFSWIVGKPEINARYDTLNEGDGNIVKLTLTVSGNCNLDSLNKIFKEDPPSFSVYENVTEYKEAFDNNEYNARKEFEITLIPKENGVHTIEPLYLSYFDPETNGYERVEIPGVTVTIDGSDTSVRTAKVQTDGSQAGGDQAQDHVVETVRIEQISYAPQNEGYWILRINKTVMLLIIAALLVFGAGAFFLTRRPVRRDEQLDDIYKQLLKAGDENEIYNHFNSMIRHCFGLSLKASSRSEIADGIRDKRFVEPVLDVVEYIEKEKFVPGMVDKKLIGMIKDIYKMLKQRRA